MDNYKVIITKTSVVELKAHNIKDAEGRAIAGDGRVTAIKEVYQAELLEG